MCVCVCVCVCLVLTYMERFSALKCPENIQIVQFKNLLIVFNGIALFVKFQLEPLKGIIEKVNKKILKKELKETAVASIFLYKITDKTVL